jgi:hypothetical protein
MGIGLFGNTKVKPIQERVLDKAFYASKRIIRIVEVYKRIRMERVIIFLKTEIFLTMLNGT